MYGLFIVFRSVCYFIDQKNKGKTTSAASINLIGTILVIFLVVMLLIFLVGSGLHNISG